MQKSIVLLLKRTITSLVVVSFLLQPLSVLAEEASVPAPANEGGPVVSEETITETGDSVESSNDGAYKQEPSSQQSQKKLPGTTGSFAVDNFSGAATYAYPFTLPQGRAGMQPNVSLSYNSHGAGQQGGIIGAGWQLSQSYVVRQNKAGTTDLYNGNYYGLVFNGEQIDLVPTDLASGTFAPQVETDFIKVSYASSTGWTVFDKKGWQYVFGDTQTARQSDPNNLSKTYSWWLRQIKDTNGNTINYSYYFADNQIYPKAINYTGKDQEVGKFEVRFEPFYSGPQASDVRPDVTTKYNTTFPVTTKYRLNKIETFTDGQKNSAYDLEYASGQNGKTSLLKSIVEKGYKNNVETVLPKVSFDYSEKEAGFVNATNDYPVNDWQDFSCYSLTTQEVHEPAITDYNGDSWSDRVSGVYSPALKKWAGAGFSFPGNLTIGAEKQYIDFDGDGLTDVFEPASSNATPPKVRYWHNNGSTFENLPFNLPQSMNQYEGNFSMEELSFVDVNGDGVGDIVFSARIAPHIGSGSVMFRNEIWVNKGDNTFEQTYGVLPVYDKDCSTAVNPPKCDSDGQYFDINNDGLVDFIKRQVYLNNGKGFDQTPSLEWSGSGNELWKGGARYYDINNDGLVDYSASYKESRLIGSTWTNFDVKKTYINNGNGWTNSTAWDSPLLYAWISTDIPDRGVRAMDLNGDGSVDIVQKICGDVPKVYLGKPGKGNLLKTVTIENGGQTTIGYTMSATITDASGNYLNKKLPVSMAVVNSINTNDGMGNESESKYQYAYGHFYVDPVHPVDNQFAGFGVVTIENGQKKIKKFFHQGGGFNGSAFGEQNDHVALRGREYREEIYNKDFDGEQLEKVTLQKWQRQVIGGNRSKVYLDSTIGFNDKNELTSVQPKVNLAFDKAVEKYIAPVKSEYEQVKDNDQKYFAKENINQVQFVPEISNQNARHYYIGKNENGYEYVGMFTAENDGYFYHTGGIFTSWQSLISATSSESISTLSPYNLITGGQGENSNQKRVSRVFLPFNTSSLPDDLNISTTTLSVCTGSMIGYTKVNIVNFYPADPNNIITSDFSHFGSNVANSNLYGANGCSGVNLTNEANNWVALSGKTFLGLRGENDMPGQEWSPYLSYNFTSSSYYNVNEWPKLIVNYIISDPLVSPSDLKVNGESNPITIYPPLEFSAKYKNEYSESKGKYYRIQVANDSSDFNNPVWDSGKLLLNKLVEINGTADEMYYVGTQLPYDGTTYKWRIKFWDEQEREGFWSFERATFDARLTGVGSAVSYEYNTQTNQVVKQNNLGKNVYDLMTGELVEAMLGDEQTTNYEYASATGNLEIVSAIKQQSVSASGDAQVYSTQVHYDNLPYGQVSKNNKTKDDLLIQQINVQTEYNNYGLPTKQIDPLGEATTIEYDNSNLYPTKVTNALGQETTFVYDDYIGQPILTVDPNGMREERVYDAFGRVVLIKRSSPTSGETMVEMEKYIYNDTSMHRSVTKQTKIDRDNWLTSVEYYNGLGQAIQSRVQFDDNNYTVTSSKYDQFGRVITATLPYLSAGSAYVPETWNRPVLEKEYDSLDRPTKETSPSGTTTYSYNGLVTTITDASGVEKKIENDAYGRLIAVEEFIDGQFQKTSYSYNALGKLTKIVDSQNNERNFTYDGLGRLVSQEDMHKPGSQNVPVWQYEYDQNSHITRQIDPRGSVTTYDYDSLGRVTHESSTDGENTYTYDQGVNAIGKLTNITSTYGVGYQQTPSYDLWGRTLTDEVTIGAKQFTTDYKYHFTGSPLEITLPNRLTYKFVYDAQAKLQKADVTSEDSAPINIVSSVTYEANGRPAKVSYANGAQTNYTYDEQTQRLKAKRTVSAEKTIQDLNYVYDNLGNITEILDSSETQTAKLVRYTYDSISRLVSAAATNTANNQNYEQTYKYDPIGNIVNKSDIGDYFYNNDNPYQATNIGTASYTYDLSGNVTADGQFSYSYNSSGRMTEATKPGLLSSYSYDPSGTRIYKKVVSEQTAEANILAADSLSATTSTPEIIDTTSTSTPTSTEPNLTIAAVENGGRRQVTETYYPNQYYELTVVDGHETVTNHVYGLGQRLAQIDNTDTGKTTKLVFTDHLGSTQVITDADGKVSATYDYYPFGGVRLEENSDSNNKKGFIGKELDETKLNYVEARYLNAATGKFGQIDPVALNHEKINVQQVDPQSFNSYAYSRNNPVVLADKNGEFWHILAGAVIGGAISGGITYWQTGDVNKSLAAAAGGAVTGAIVAAAAPATLLAAAVSGAGGNAIGGMVSKALSGEKITADSVAFDAGTGAIGGAVGYGAGKAVGKAIEKVTTKPIKAPVSSQDANVAQPVKAWVLTPKESLPGNAQSVIEHIERNNFTSPMPGYKGGKSYRNDQLHYPAKNQSRYYTEWDVNPKPPRGTNRDSLRIVTGSNGEIYYSDQHYANPKRIN